MQQSHVKEVAALHVEALGGLLSSLGETAARAFYRGYLMSPSCVAFVAEDHGRVRGFVLGAKNPEQMKRDALRARPLRLFTGLGVGLLRRPDRLRALFDTAVPFDPRAPELTYIAVRDRGTGVGTALLDAFSHALPGFELSVEQTNERAVRFYEARGLRRTRTYEQFGATYFRYASVAG